MLHHMRDHCSRVRGELLLRHAAAPNLHADAGAGGDAQRRSADGLLDGGLRVIRLNLHRERKLQLLRVEDSAEELGHHLHDPVVAEEKVEGVRQGPLGLERVVVFPQLLHADHLLHGARVLLQQQLLVGLLRVLGDEADLSLVVVHGVRQRDHEGLHPLLVRDLAQGEEQGHGLGAVLEQRVRVRGSLRDDLRQRADPLGQDFLLDLELLGLGRRVNRHRCRDA
mmetsp:Transcript_59801/g.175449  ORF Transcript_59801/g.175449 Transcript_59801/m.175449 type:complete len:224 (+) Transcript_59801:496-1167(+)